MLAGTFVEQLDEMSAADAAAASREAGGVADIAAQTGSAT